MACLKHVHSEVLKYRNNYGLACNIIVTNLPDLSFEWTINIKIQKKFEEFFEGHVNLTLYADPFLNGNKEASTHPIYFTPRNFIWLHRGWCVCFYVQRAAL